MKQSFDAEFYKKILDQMNSNIFVTDVETDEIIYMNDFMKNTFHLKQPEGQVCWKVLQKDMSGPCPFCQRFQPQKDASVQETACAWREYNTINGRVYMHFDHLEALNGRIYHIQNSVDITERLKLSAEASMDELTGVWNRKAGKLRLTEMLSQLKQDVVLTVALLDINNLKWVNDLYGHLEGDRLLSFTAQEMKGKLSPSDLLFRLSGDEFVVALQNQDAAQADVWMQSMLKALEIRRVEESLPYMISFSYGFACVHGWEPLSVSDILSTADAQMYIQKRDHHIMMSKKKLLEDRLRAGTHRPFQYNKDNLFDVLSESLEDYAFVGNLKTGEFMYSRNMVEDFSLPGQVLSNAAAFWSEMIHPDDVTGFLQSNQEIADGRAESHAVTYRAKAADGRWVPLLCKGKMLRDEEGRPDLFAGIILNLSKTPRTGLPPIKKMNGGTE